VSQATLRLEGDDNRYVSVPETEGLLGDRIAIPVADKTIMASYGDVFYVAGLVPFPLLFVTVVIAVLRRSTA
jgi:hypothetical protein